ncbi:ArsR family transcriptional regulator [Piscirickettsia salmonis]|uniref:Cadmium efflux system accessory protein n=1 Tax=Piscirickettsia salmonis TaxID=1238 RepID=A0A9Q5VAT4_PISSA|nr:metalloregulator ArsR/SmtB family transcription factor [Piscirickettsia salmonis]RNC77286.1 ArsR family transcriptional regulator [Piscirickettsiaceae bacterium NZ-RLO2]ALA25658.1 bacterial regulatory, arsR family protein [Piscirickettsia salmonis]APS43152.1 ArsR family transcriptional regulator [Piscirickettsia salmonis]APS46499.1 ArsR family transcriptional regulator [Piscirickettsia salmonis]APS50469.1 ArsR family transcriptional regulator [Piscirickettsia salmonis]
MITSKKLSKILKAFSDENRRLILWFLQKRELCVCELEQLLPISQPTISNHLRMLSDLDLVDSYKEGRWVIYQKKCNQDALVINILKPIYCAMDLTGQYESQLEKLKIIFKDNLC